MRRLFALLLVLTALAPGFAAHADDDRRGDHDDARRAFERGEAQPLSQILKRVQTVAPGEVLEVEMDRENGRLVYEIEVLQRSGRVLEITVDARSGAVLSVEDDD